MPPILLHGAASALYAGLALYFWNVRWRAVSAAQRSTRALERVAILMPALLHGWLLYSDIFTAPEPRLGFAHALSAMLWLGVVLFWIESNFLELRGVEPFPLAGAALAAPLPALFPGRLTFTYGGSPEFLAHVTLGLLAYGVIGIAVLHLALMVAVERRLHGSAGGGGRNAASTLGGPLANLPPLLTLERLLFRLIGTAFVLITLTVGLGIAFSESIYGKPFRFDHKTLFSLLAWATLLLLLGGRHFYGWRGQTAMRWTMASFIFLMLAYVGRSFVLEVVLGRA
jgi:ABC-type uncharacterized transport system permease subunit